MHKETKGATKSLRIYKFRRHMSNCFYTLLVICMILLVVALTRDLKNLAAYQPHKYLSTCTYVQFYRFSLRFYEIYGRSKAKNNSEQDQINKETHVYHCYK